MILVGDIGGTKTLLEAGTFLDGPWRPALCGRYIAADFPNLNSVLHHFLEDWSTTRGSQDTVTHACFGVAGPMLDNRVEMTNLPWVADSNAISAEFNIPNVSERDGRASASKRLRKQERQKGSGVGVTIWLRNYWTTCFQVFRTWVRNLLL